MKESKGARNERQHERSEDAVRSEQLPTHVLLWEHVYKARSLKGNKGLHVFPVLHREHSHMFHPAAKTHTELKFSTASTFTDTHTHTFSKGTRTEKYAEGERDRRSMIGFTLRNVCSTE